MKKLIFLLTIAISYSQSATLNFGNIDYENNTLEILASTDMVILGYSLQLTGLTLTGCQQVMWQSEGCMCGYSSDGNLIGWAFDGMPLYPDEGVMVIVSFENGEDSEVCIEDPIFAIEASDPIIPETGDCIWAEFDQTPPDVIISFGNLDLENNIVEFNITTLEPVCCMQFDVVGITLGNWLWEMGGLVYENGLMAGSTTDGGVLIHEFGFEGFVPPENGMLAAFEIVSIDSLYACIENPEANFFGDILIVEAGECISTNGCTLMGDVNQDNFLNVLDVVIVVDCILNSSDCPCGDLTEDETLDVIDLFYMIALILEDN
ncbi:MAG: hypothetical protein HQ510_07530 [Candidatus Marinimicrobia bacterium]|nr:hypothetical protein [Candidatus Neomarinimicrobiota bacterium]